MSARKIYIVEDEAILAADLSLRLRKMGYEVVGMGLDGAEALADIPRLQPDLVLMDIYLGAGQDGIEVSKQLRDQWEGPIIYLTSYIDDITLSRAKQANAAAYLVKPFLDTNEIKANIEVALHRHEMQQQARKSNMVLQQTLKGLQDAVVVLDENSKTVLVNPAAKTMLDLTDYGEDELSIMNLRKQFQTTYNEVAIDALSDAEWSAFARQRAAEGPFKVQTRTPKGNTLFLEVSPTLMPKLGEEGFLYIMTLRDLNAQDLITSLSKGFLQFAGTSVGQEFLYHLSVQLSLALKADLVMVMQHRAGKPGERWPFRVLTASHPERLELIEEEAPETVYYNRTIRLGYLHEESPQPVSVPGLTFAVRTFTGIALYNSAGQVIGALCVYYAVRHSQELLDQQVLRLFANRVAAEVERYGLEEELTEERNKLEHTVRERTRQLQEVNARLREEIEEREQIGQELLQSELRYRTLFENNPAGVFLVNTEGMILFANQSSERILRIDRQHLMGLSLLGDHIQYVNSNNQPIPQTELPLYRTLKGREYVTDVVLGYHNTVVGEMMWQVMNTAPVFDREGKLEGAVVSFFDITEQRRRELENKRQERILQLLNEANAQLMGGPTAEDALNEVLSLLANGLQIDKVSLARCYPGHVGAVTRYSQTREGYADSEPLLEYSAQVVPTLSQTLQKGQPFLLKRGELTGEEKRFFREKVGKQYLALPLQYSGKLLGFLVFQNKEVTSPPIQPNELVLLQTFASTLAAYIRQMEAREALEESQGRLQAAFRAGNIFVVEVDTVTLDLVYASPGCNTHFGFAEDQQLNASDIVKLVAPEDRIPYEELLNLNSLPTNSTRPYQVRMLLTDHRRIYVRGMIFFKWEENLQRHKVIITVQDVTDLVNTQLELEEINVELEKRVEERTLELANINLELQQEIEFRRFAEIRLRESETRFRGLFDQSLDAIVIVDPKGRIVNANAATAKLLGVEPENLTHKALADFLADKKEAGFDFSNASFSREPYRRGEAAFQTSSGIRQVEYSARKSFQPGLNLAILRDVTEKHQVAAQLNALNERYANILESITDGFFALDAHLKFTYINQQAEKLIGLTRKKLLGKGLAEIPDELLDWPVISLLNKSKSQQEKFHLEIRQKPYDRWLELDIYPFEGGVGIYFRDITARKTSDSLIREKEERYRALFERSQESILLHNAKGIIQEVNPTAAQLLGYANANELVGNSIFPLIAEGQRDMYREQVNRALTTNERSDYLQLEFVKEDHGQVLTNVNLTVIRHENQPMAVQLLVRDMTDFLLNQRMLESSQANLRAILENTDQGFMLLDLNYRVKVFNQTMHDWFYMWKGLDVEMEMDFLSALDKDISLAMTTVFEETLRKGKVEGEWPVEFVDGRTRWYRYEYITVYDAEGALIGVLVVSTDIHDPKMARLELERRERRYSTLARNAFDITAVVSAHGELAFVTPSVESILHYPTAELVGKDGLQLVHPDNQPDVSRAFQAIAHEPGRYTILEFRLKNAYGLYVDVEARVLNKLDDPEIQGYIVNVMDITDRLQAQRQLQLLGAAVETATDAIIITSAGDTGPEPQIVYVNSAFCRMTGYSPDEVIGRNPRILQGELTDHSTLDRLRISLSRGEKFTGESYNYRKDGTPYRVEWNISPIRDYRGRLTHWLSTQRDVTEKRMLEERMQRDREERQQAVTAAILQTQESERKRIANDLHDGLGILLSVLKMNFSRLPSSFPKLNEPQTEILTETSRLLDEATMEARNISRNLSPPTLHQFGLVSAMRQMLRMVKEDPKLQQKGPLPKIIFRETLGEKRLGEMVELNTYRIFQEALNNALKYSLAQQITITLKLHAEKGLSLRISDNGTGFNRETKPQGSGMGLTSVETRAQLIGAQLKVDSQPGRGTTVMLEIPNTSLYLGNN